MLTADIWPTLPEDPTWVFFGCLALIVGYFLLRAYTANQQIQINGLRESLDRQADRHTGEMREMRSKIDRLEAVTEEARTERHRLRGEVATLRMAIGIVSDLYTHCTCHALEPIRAVLNSLSKQEDS